MAKIEFLSQYFRCVCLAILLVIIEGILLFGPNAAYYEGNWHIFANLSTYLVNSWGGTVMFAGAALVQGVLALPLLACTGGPMSFGNTLLNCTIYAASNLFVFSLAYVAPLCTEPWTNASAWADATRCSNEGHGNYTTLAFAMPLMLIVINCAVTCKAPEGTHIDAQPLQLVLNVCVEVASFVIIFLFLRINELEAVKQGGLLALLPLVLELSAIALLAAGGILRVMMELDLGQKEWIVSAGRSGLCALAIQIFTVSVRGCLAYFESAITAVVAGFFIGVLFTGCMACVAWCGFYVLPLLGGLREPSIVLDVPNPFEYRPTQTIQDECENE